MTLETRIVSLAQAIGSDIKALNANQGILSSLNTTQKANLVSAINELFSTVSAIKIQQESYTQIDDTVTDATHTWSATKIESMIEEAKTAVKNSLVDGAASALDTLKELSEALGNDPSFATTLATQMANRVRFDEAQNLTEEQKTQARSNIGAVSLAAIGNYDRDLVADYGAAKL